VATNPEAIGQLLANSALMKGERELMRRQEEPSPEASKAPAQPKAQPIVTDSKAVASVLLTLLDEQLHATEAALAGQPKNANLADGEASASKRVAAKYTADGLIAGSDLGRAELPAANDQVRAPTMPPIASADLQTFVQRFAALAAAQSAIADRDNTGRARRGIAMASAVFSGASGFRLMGVGAALLWLLGLVVQWAAQ
jgi:hypothetical protein